MRGQRAESSEEEAVVATPPQRLRLLTALDKSSGAPAGGQQALCPALRLFILAPGGYN